MEGRNRKEWMGGRMDCRKEGGKDESKRFVGTYKLQKSARDLRWWTTTSQEPLQAKNHSKLPSPSNMLCFFTYDDDMFRDRAVVAAGS